MLALEECLNTWHMVSKCRTYVSVSVSVSRVCVLCMCMCMENNRAACRLGPVGR